MTNLDKPIRRVTTEVVYDRGRTRKIVVVLYPGGLIGFRLQGTRKEYQTSLQRCYDVAVSEDITMKYFPGEAPNG